MKRTILFLYICFLGILAVCGCVTPEPYASSSAAPNEQPLAQSKKLIYNESDKECSFFGENIGAEYGITACSRVLAVDKRLFDRLFESEYDDCLFVTKIGIGAYAYIRSQIYARMSAIKNEPVFLEYTGDYSAWWEARIAAPTPEDKAAASPIIARMLGELSEEYIQERKAELSEKVFEEQLLSQALLELKSNGWFDDIFEAHWRASHSSDDCTDYEDTKYRFDAANKEYEDLSPNDARVVEILNEKRQQLKACGVIFLENTAGPDLALIPAEVLRYFPHDHAVGGAIEWLDSSVKADASFVSMLNEYGTYSPETDMIEIASSDSAAAIPAQSISEADAQSLVFDNCGGSDISWDVPGSGIVTVFDYSPLHVALESEETEGGMYVCAFGIYTHSKISPDSPKNKEAVEQECARLTQHGVKFFDGPNGEKYALVPAEVLRVFPGDVRYGYDIVWCSETAGDYLAEPLRQLGFSV